MLRQTLETLTLCTVLSAPFSARAGVLWRGDYETGNLAQWSKEQSVASNRLVVENEDVIQGHYAMRATVVHGDNPINASGNRNELVLDDLDASGQERVYSWWTQWPGDYPSETGWQVFTQWHQTDAVGDSPPIQLYVAGETMYLRVLGGYWDDHKDWTGGILWSAPLQRGPWHHFTMRVRWSASAGNGLVQLYYDGKQVVSPRALATLYHAGQTVYLKQGLYRDATIKPTASLLHDGMIKATELGDVSP